MTSLVLCVCFFLKCFIQHLLQCYRVDIIKQPPASGRFLKWSGWTRTLVWILKHNWKILKRMKRTTSWNPELNEALIKEKKIDSRRMHLPGLSSRQLNSNVSECVGPSAVCWAAVDEDVTDPLDLGKTKPISRMDADIHNRTDPRSHCTSKWSDSGSEDLILGLWTVQSFKELPYKPSLEKTSTCISFLLS